jgi:exodeoxyribonuclease V alpha subunit
MAHLFSAIKPGARLILLGDPHQLPPVETGSVFADLILSLEEHFPDSLTLLNKCLRAEKQELISLGRAINEGNSDKVSELLSQKGSTVQRFPLGSDPSQFIEHAVPFFQRLFVGAKTPHDFLQAFNRFRLLSPLRQGSWGVDALNRALWNRLKSAGAVPIMLTSTNEKLSLFNGEVGILIQAEGKSDEFSQGDCAYFSPQNEGEPVRCISALLLPKFEYAYAISVYKSQGSEFDHVMLLLPAGSEVFGREVFYTAVTRAKSRLDVWCEVQTMKKTLEKKCHRLSGVRQKIGSYIPS